MYIEISENFATALCNNEGNDLWDVLDNIKIAMREGYHLINCESKNAALCIAEIAKAKNKDDIYSLFNEIYNSFFMENYAVKESVTRYISIVSTLTTVLEQESKKIEVGLDIAKRMAFWNASFFLIEDPTDAKFYKWICEYIRNRFFPNYKILAFEYEVKRGGGTNISSDYQSHERNRFLFCIVDSDKKYPDSTYGATASKLNDNCKPDTFTSYYILPVHEIENLFFTKALSESISPPGVDVVSIDKTIKAAETIHFNFRMYYDVKKGFTKRDVINNDYILDALSEKKDCECQNFSDCRGNVNNKVDCHYLIRGYGKYLNFLSEKYDNNKELFVHDANNNPDFIMDCWKEIEKFIFTWSCARKINTHNI